MLNVGLLSALLLNEIGMCRIGLRSDNIGPGAQETDVYEILQNPLLAAVDEASHLGIFASLIGVLYWYSLSALCFNRQVFLSSSMRVKSMPWRGFSATSLCLVLWTISAYSAERRLRTAVLG